jgi:aryl-alcohol dehydrogenase-like predicted oxidoreductase
MPPARRPWPAALEPAARVDLRAAQDPFGVEPTVSPYLPNRPSIDARERLWAARCARIPGAVPSSWPALSAPDRPLGTTGLRLPPLAISGRYGLPEEALDEALDRGARLFFWEPTYEGQTRWLRRIPAARRAGLAFIAGTFEASPRAVRRDAEAALRLLRVEAIDVFVVFWARSKERLGEDVLETLARLMEAGHVRTFGLSTHRRDLAAGAVEQGWPVVMVRHSAAHRGAEDEVFPAARAAGAGVLTFSNVCYGRMLRAQFGDPPAPADCYRYSLAQPGVTTAISGPRDVLQLRENLRVLEDPDLPADRLAGLRAFGDRVHADNREFFELVRWR